MGGGGGVEFEPKGNVTYIFLWHVSHLFIWDHQSQSAHECVDFTNKLNQLQISHLGKCIISNTFLNLKLCQTLHPSHWFSDQQLHNSKWHFVKLFNAQVVHTIPKIHQSFWSKLLQYASHNWMGSSFRNVFDWWENELRLWSMHVPYFMWATPTSHHGKMRCH
jgi:hypothetical protein